jgi:hypothetical protein
MRTITGREFDTSSGLRPPSPRSRRRREAILDRTFTRLHPIPATRRRIVTISLHCKARLPLTRVDVKAAENLLLEHGAKGPVLSPKPNSGPQVLF